MNYLNDLNLIMKINDDLIVVTHLLNTQESGEFVSVVSFIELELFFKFLGVFIREKFGQRNGMVMNLSLHGNYLIQFRFIQY